MWDEVDDLLALIPTQGAGGMDTDRADKKLAKKTSVDVQHVAPDA